MNNLRLFTALVALVGLLNCAECRVLTLDEIFEYAESGSSQLRPAITSVDEADKGIAEARSSRLPDISAELNVSYIGDGFTTRRNFSDYQRAEIPHLGTGLTLAISQPVYTGGAITSAIDIAELKSTAARFAADLRRDNIRFELTGYYLDIYKCANLRKVVDANITAAEKVLADMKARFEQGTALQNDITRYELLLSNLRLQAVKLDNNLAILNSNIVSVAGLPAGTIVEPDTTILDRSLPREGEGLWQQEASSNAPALRLAGTGLDISRKAEQLAKADRLPKIGIRAAWTLDGPILVEVPPINRNLSYWYVGLGISYNISSLYKSNKTLARSRAATQVAADELAAAREGVEMAVRADYIHYLEAFEELKTQEKSIELAERNYNITETRYSADMALITDMLDAANSRIDAAQKLVNARINIIYYYYKLLFTSGKI